MFGWLLGTIDKKVVLIKINVNKIKSQNNVVDKNNATYYTKEFIITEIKDEYNDKYICANIKKIIDSKFCKNIILNINEPYENVGIFFYNNIKRALCDIFLYKSKSSGTFQQFLLNGNCVGEITFLNGRVIK
jgi:hypothetical protein